MNAARIAMHISYAPALLLLVVGVLHAAGSAGATTYSVDVFSAYPGYDVNRILAFAPVSGSVMLQPAPAVSSLRITRTWAVHQSVMLWGKLFTHLCIIGTHSDGPTAPARLAGRR